MSTLPTMRKVQVAQEISEPYDYMARLSHKSQIQRLQFKDTPRIQAVNINIDTVNARPPEYNIIIAAHTNVRVFVYMYVWYFNANQA